MNSDTLYRWWQEVERISRTTGRGVELAREIYRTYVDTLMKESDQARNRAWREEVMQAQREWNGLLPK